MGIILHHIVLKLYYGTRESTTPSRIQIGGQCQNSDGGQCFGEFTDGNARE